MGPDYKRRATADEIQRMTELVSDGMTQGAFGLGMDLQHEPGSLSAPAALIELSWLPTPILHCMFSQITRLPSPKSTRLASNVWTSRQIPTPLCNLRATKSS